MEDFEIDSEDLSDFFSAISKGKEKRKKQLEETVGNSVEDFFSTVSYGKNIVKKKKESLVGDSFDVLWENITNKKPKKIISEKVKKEEINQDIVVESKSEIIQEPISEANFVDPPYVKNSDPLTPTNQNFATLDDLQKHYKLFLNRIQQQLATLGGGGETRLEFLDDVNRNSVKSDHKFLRYDAPSKKWIGAYAGEAPFISTTTYITSSSYTITENDYYIGVNYAGAVTITLPTGVVEGTTYIVKDELGEASKGTNRYITILPSGSDKIDGRDRAILAYDFGSLTFVYRNGWRVV